MEATATDPKLSDYMLAGMKVTRPSGNFLVTYRHDVYACAIGAACFAKNRAVALEMEDVDAAAGFAQDLFPELSDLLDWQGDELSYLEPGPTPLLAVITYLNDVVHWRRDRIARFLKKLGY